MSRAMQQTALTTSTTSDLVQPLLVESSEFRRRADSDRADAITKIERIDQDIATRKAELQSLQARREDLMLIVTAVEQTLVIIPGPREAPAVDAET